MFLSWEPETVFSRILATGGKWDRPLQELNLPIFTDIFKQRFLPCTYFSINKHKIKGRHFFHSREADTPSLASSKNFSDGSCMWWWSGSFASLSSVCFPHMASIHMSLGSPSTSLAVLSQASVRFSSLHVGGSRAQSLSFLSNYTHPFGDLILSQNFECTYVPSTTPHPPHSFLYTKSRLVYNCVINIATWVFNRRIKLNSLTETPHLSS